MWAAENGTSGKNTESSLNNSSKNIFNSWQANIYYNVLAAFQRKEGLSN